jgi:hypothetical protein
MMPPDESISVTSEKVAEAGFAWSSVGLLSRWAAAQQSLSTCQHCPPVASRNKSPPVA